MRKEKGQGSSPAGNGLSHTMWFSSLAVRALFGSLGTGCRPPKSVSAPWQAGESQALLADSSSATLSLSLVVPGVTRGVRAAEEHLNPSTQPARRVPSPLSNPNVVTQSYNHSPELNTSTGHFQQQGVLPGHCFVQAKSPRHVRKS